MRDETIYISRVSRRDRVQKYAAWGITVVAIMRAITRISNDRNFGLRSDGKELELLRAIDLLACPKEISKLEGHGFLDKVEKLEKLILNKASNIAQSIKIHLPLTRVSSSPACMEQRLA